MSTTAEAPTPVGDGSIAAAADDKTGEAANMSLGNAAASGLSALRDNIASKGRNAYYYAHSHKADGPAWDGKPEPKLLGRTESSLATSAKATPTFDIHKSNITSYAFLDEGKKVRLYVDLKGVGGSCEGKGEGDEGGEDAKDEASPKVEVKLDWSETSMCLMVTNYPKDGETRCLSFGRLHGKIENGTVKTKKDRLVVTLVKKCMEVEPAEDTDTGEGDGGEETEPPEPKYEEWPAIAAKGEPEHELV